MLPRPKGRWVLGRVADLGSRALDLGFESEGPALCLGSLPSTEPASLQGRGGDKVLGAAQWSAHFSVVCAWHGIRGEGNKMKEQGKNKEANGETGSMSEGVRGFEPKAQRSQASSLPPGPTWMVV